MSGSKVFVLCVFQGLSYLHLIRVLHRDLKSSNVLLDKDYRAKICDFGLSEMLLDLTTKDYQTQNHSALGVVRWLAPEMMKPVLLCSDQPVMCFLQDKFFSSLLLVLFHALVPNLTLSSFTGEARHLETRFQPIVQLQV
jgi:serine/threonine protein kinase